MNSNLSGVRVACFYPWKAFEPSGSWSRFECLWKFLLDQGAHVTLAFLDKGQEGELENLSIRRVGEHPALNGLANLAIQIGQDPSAELRRYTPVEREYFIMYEKSFYMTTPRVEPWLEEIIQGVDLVTCEYPLQAGLLAGFCKKANKPLVVTSHDLLFELHSASPEGKELLRQQEIKAMALADARVFCSDKERQYFADLGFSGTTVLSTGDAKGLALGNEDACRAAVQAQLKTKIAEYCFFVGTKHGPNMEAVGEFRKLAKQFPKLLFIVAGSCHAPAVEENFIALGHVDALFLDTLHRGAYAIVIPMVRGTGISVKIFQAMSYGKPIVSTAIGARAFPVVDGEHMLIVPTPQDVPAALKRLRADDGLAKALGARARELALKLDFRNEFLPYAEIINGLLKRTPGDAPTSPPALVLVDNNLKNHTGHHFNYAMSLKAECQAQALRFNALIHSGATGDVKTALGAVPVFDQGIHQQNSANPYPADWGALRSTYDFLLSNDTFCKELENGLGLRSRTSDLVYIPNATPGQILGLALLLHNRPHYRCLRYVLMLRYSLQFAVGPLNNRRTGVDREAAERYALGLEKLMSTAGGCVRLATDSAELAKEYQALVRAPVEVLPIPHTAHHRDPSVWPAEIPPKTPGKKRIVFLGDARDEKGFELLPAVVKGCSGANFVSVEFVFQAFVSSLYHGKMVHVVEEIERLNRPNVHLVNRGLTPDAYEAFLETADIVLLPYCAHTYRARTSGPFVEAICANKPVVVTKLTWMSRLLGDSNAGTTFQSGNAQDLVKAVASCIANLETHRAAAAELGATFRAYHNPTSFLKALMQRG